jgi:hypothetical protein
LNIEPETRRLHHSLEQAIKLVAVKLDQYGTAVRALGGEFDLIQLA